MSTEIYTFRGSCHARREEKWIFSSVRWTKRDSPTRVTVACVNKLIPFHHSSRLPRASGLGLRLAEALCHMSSIVTKLWTSSNSFVYVPSPPPQLERDAASSLDNPGQSTRCSVNYFCWIVVQRTAALKFGLFDPLLREAGRGWGRHWQNSLEK